MAQFCSNFCKSIFVTHITNTTSLQTFSTIAYKCSKFKFVLILRQGLT